MRLPSSFQLTYLRGTVERWSHTIVSELGKTINSLTTILNGQIGFGDGVDADNLKGQWITTTSSATPGAEFSISHNLGEVPVAFIVMMPPAQGYVTKGSTAWTSTAIYLVVVGATSQSFTIFLLPSSQGSA